MASNPILDGLKNPWDIATTIKPRAGSALLTKADTDPTQVASPNGTGTLYPDPALVNYAYRSRLDDELGDRAFNAIRGGDVPELAGLQFLMGKNAQDQSNSPIGQSVEAQKAGDVAQQQATSAANIQGFPTSQAAAAYGRTQNENLLQATLDKTRAEASGEIGRGDLERSQAEYYRQFKPLESQAALVKAQNMLPAGPSANAQKDLAQLEMEKRDILAGGIGSSVEDSSILLARKLGLPLSMKTSSERLADINAQIAERQGQLHVPGQAPTAHPPELDALPPGHYSDDATGAIWQKDATGNITRVR